VRILYLTPGHPAHDDRFVGAIAAIGHEPVPVVVGSDDPAIVERAIRKVRPDVVHAGPIWPVAWSAARARARPLVTASWAYDLLGVSTAQERDRAVWTLGQTDVLIADSEASFAVARELGMPAGRLIRLPWGVDLTTFRPPPVESRRQRRESLGWQDAVVVVTARSHEPVYGVDVVLDGFAIAAAAVPNLRLLVVGGGSLTAKLQQRAVALGLGDRVRFSGPQANTDLAESLATADIYVSASHLDGSSVTLLEAMATALPVVVSDIAGNREWVQDRVTGLWFPDGDAAALGSGLAALAVAPATMRTEMGAEGRAIVVDKADWSRNRWRLNDAYAMARDRTEPGTDRSQPGPRAEAR
jgi:glycosyltransferase involved in cell wall biosynthesis